MAGILHTLLLLSFILHQVTGHAVLITPPPLNKNAVASPPCAATIPNLSTATPVATYAPGSNQVITWRLIAGDGGNAVTGIVDPNGGTNFDLNAGAVAMWTGTKSHGSAINTNYDIAFTVPSTLTSCPNGLCTFQVRSNVNNWVSCALINITECIGCPTPTPAPPTCKKSGTLNFCGSVMATTNANVYVPADASPATLDANAKAAYDSYIVNRNVFENNSTDCQKKFKKFLCATNLPPCAGASGGLAEGAACRSMCRDAMTSCGITETHKNLYDCDSLPLCNGETDSSSFSFSPSFAAAAAISTAAAVALFN